MSTMLVAPLDVWYFGTGRPFEAGEEHVAESLFPPLPRTVVGALRASILRSFDCAPTAYGRLGDGSRATGVLADAVKAIGAPSAVGPEELRVRGPFVTKWPGNGSRIEPLFPVPADVVTAQGSDALEYLRPLCDAPQTASSLTRGLHALWVRRSGTLDMAALRRRLVDPRVLQRLLLGKSDVHTAELEHADSLFAVERRAGNALLSDQKTTREGYLYEVGLVSPRSGLQQRASDEPDRESSVGLACEVEGLDLKRIPGYLQLGGEARWAMIHRDMNISWPEPPPAGITRFKVYIATPCVLDEGWLPDWLPAQGSCIVGEHPLLGKQVTLVSVAIAGKAGVGGYDLAKRASRGLRLAVPAGSVYFFESEQPLCKQDIHQLHLNCFGDSSSCDSVSDDYKLGMGLSFIGSWDYA